ncbi:MAG TPA: ABC transporter substrate-binding protein [Mycobacteriales bacterium]|nr:ABC transporter substrate-binding protein [Mycobacteriales bacterium]
MNVHAAAALLDLGVDVLGVYDEGAQSVSPRYRGKWQTATKIGTAGQISVEKVAAVHPDLIIGVDYDYNTKVYGQLSELAPTVIAAATGWQQIARTVANAVDRTAKLAALAQQLTQQSAAIKSRYAGTLARYRWDILQGGVGTGQYWLYGPGSDIGQILAGAGVRFATGTAQTRGTGNRALSYEKIDALADADVLGFYSNYDGTPNNEAPQLFAQQAFKNLAASRNDRLVPFPDFLPGGYGDALAVLDELEAGLEKLSD